LCFDAETGEELWSYYTEGLCNGWSTPAFAYDNIYIALTDHAFETIGKGEMHCLNASTGEVLWKKYLGYWLSSSPAVADGKVYVNSMDWWGNDGFPIDGYTHCIDAWSGDIVWKYWLLGGTQSSPAIADGSVYVAVFGYLVKIDDSAPDNNPPEVELSGETKIELGKEYTYTIKAHDPEDSDIYVVYATSDEPDGYTGYKCKSGEIEEIYRTWNKTTNTIMVRAQDTHLAWSDWAVLNITEINLSAHFLIGSIEYVEKEEKFSFISAKRVLSIQFLPFDITVISSGKEIIISNNYMGFVGNLFMIGRFKADMD
jgi:hypothetical protein